MPLMILSMSWIAYTNSRFKTKVTFTNVSSYICDYPELTQTKWGIVGIVCVVWGFVPHWRKDEFNIGLNVDGLLV